MPGASKPFVTPAAGAATIADAPHPMSRAVGLGHGYVLVFAAPVEAT